MTASTFRTFSDPEAFFTAVRARRVDGMASIAQTRLDPSGGAPATFPPNYVRTEDDGRPPH